MADEILKNTLAGLNSSLNPTLPATPKGLTIPDTTGNNQTDIRNLQAAQNQPSLLMNFQKVMQMTSRQAYNERQSQEMGLAGQQFDPTKVSGGTFAGIISNLEANRGADISKVYASTMNTYTKVQEQITSRLEFLQQLEEQKRQWEEEMKMRKKEIKMLEKQNKQAAKMEKEKFEMEKKSWELSYQKQKNSITQDTSYLNTQLEDILANQYYGQNVQNGQNMSYNTPNGMAPKTFTDWLNINNQ